jgi:hypothetical protein
VKTGKQTTRIENLWYLFGQHNYRIYELDRGMGKQLLYDVLSQHRRLHRAIDLGKCLVSVAKYVDFDVVPELIVEHTRQVGLRSHYLSDLATLAASEEKYLEAFLRAIELHLDQETTKRLDLGYRSYLLDLVVCAHSPGDSCARATSFRRRGPSTPQVVARTQQLYEPNRAALRLVTRL